MSTGIAMAMTVPLDTVMLLEVEDPVETGIPRIGEVETLTPEKGANNDEDRPEHQMNSLYADRKFAILWCIRRISIDVGSET